MALTQAQRANENGKQRLIDFLETNKEAYAKHASIETAFFPRKEKSVVISIEEFPDPACLASEDTPSFRSKEIYAQHHAELFNQLAAPKKCAVADGKSLKIWVAKVQDIEVQRKLDDILVSIVQRIHPTWVEPYRALSKEIEQAAKQFEPEKKEEKEKPDHVSLQVDLKRKMIANCNDHNFIKDLTSQHEIYQLINELYKQKAELNAVKEPDEIQRASLEVINQLLQMSSKYMVAKNVDLAATQAIYTQLQNWLFQLRNLCSGRYSASQPKCELVSLLGTLLHSDATPNLAAALDAFKKGKVAAVTEEQSGKSLAWLPSHRSVSAHRLRPNTTKEAASDQAARKPRGSN